ncbi:MAG: SLC13 family permease [Rhizobiaceae bacterium]
MTYEQIFLFSLFGIVFFFLIYGKPRYDLVAFTALIIATLAGFIKPYDAFAGFGHPAVVIISLVLIISRGLLNSGAVEAIATRILDHERPVSAHIGILSVVGAGLSAIINNVAALALLMTVDMEAARKAGRAPSRTLMALSFATILGGMITLIGTPPNIVISQYRQQALGEPFQMFDFSPVGLVVAGVGILFVALIGWRFVPEREDKHAGEEGESGLFIAEARPRAKSKSIGIVVSELLPLANDKDIHILGLVRRGKRLRGFAHNEEIRKSDYLVLEGEPKAIEEFIGAAELDYSGSEKHGGMASASLVLQEVIIPENSRLIGRSAKDVRLQYRFGVTLLGVSREGRNFRQRVRELPLKSGDMLLLLGPAKELATVSNWLGVFPIAKRETAVLQRNRALMSGLLFALAIGASVAGFAELTITLAACVIGYAALGIVGGSEIYETVEWKVIVLLASLIPLSAALEESGGTQLIANTIVSATDGWPAWSVLLVLMAITMTLSDFLNNVATALIAAPIGLNVANSIGASPDAFLMGVAVAASCAFLTPIGHKNNTIIMGPGSYRFGDYWYMGLPLELLVLAVSVPAILFFWPL